MKKSFIKLFLGSFFLLMFFCNCGDESSIRTDRAYAFINFFSKETFAPVKLTQLTVTAANTDSILIKEKPQIENAKLPLNFKAEQTEFYFKYSEELIDTITITHKNHAHFISIENGAIIYHNIEKVDYSTNLIDSIAIKNPGVTEDEKENLQIYFQ